ncbi:MAG: ribonuclease Z [Propionibacteriaceae bacterium]|nr:ribonuclease Z [Propionibacteriaceae bacterium]
MSDLRFTALGTSSLVPTKVRNHNGYHLDWRGKGLLFDCGEGTQRQLTFAGIGARSLHVIALTHLHGDHCLGLPGVLQRISLDRSPHPVVLAFPAESQDYVERLYRASIYHDQAEIRFLPVDASDEPRVILSTPQFVLSAASLDHRVPAVGYRVEEPPGITFDKAALAERGIQGPLVGQLSRDGRVEIDGRVTTVEEVSRPREGASMAFIMDTRPCRGAELLARGVDLMVMEATYANDCAPLADEHGHTTAEQAARIAVAAGARRLALTHFSTRYTDTKAHLAEASAIHPDVVTLNDLDRLPVRNSR